MSILKCNGKIFVLSGSPLTWNVISIPTVTSNLTYTGNIQSPTITGYDENTMTRGGATSKTNAGTYEITFTPKSGYQWADGTSGTKTFTWSIAKRARNMNVVTSAPIVIDANSTETVVKVYGSATAAVDYAVSNTQVATAATKIFMQGRLNVKVTKVGPGTCTITVNVPETTNELAASCSFDVACYTTAEVPSQSGALTYMDYVNQSPSWDNYNSTYLTIGGTTKGHNAGTYTATFTPNAPYVTWTDGSSDTKNVNWTIERATISTPYLVTNTFVYTGRTQFPNFIGYNNNKMSRGGTTAASNVGHYEATFTPHENYQWPGGDTGTIGVGWLIYKAAGSLSLSTNSLTIDANSTTGSFTVTRAGDGAIQATSSDTSVATVDVSGNTVTVNRAVGKTWILKNDPGWSDGDFEANFVSNNERFTTISSVGVKNQIYYRNGDSSKRVCFENWIDQGYRILTFDEVPTGALLTWLQTNGTPYSETKSITITVTVGEGTNYKAVTNGKIVTVNLIY